MIKEIESISAIYSLYWCWMLAAVIDFTPNSGMEWMLATVRSKSQNYTHNLVSGSDRIYLLERAIAGAWQLQVQFSLKTQWAITTQSYWILLAFFICAVPAQLFIMKPDSGIFQLHMRQNEICWKMDGAAQNQPNECIKGVSKEQNETRLNYVLVGRLCNLESLWVEILWFPTKSSMMYYAF